MRAQLESIARRANVPLDALREQIERLRQTPGQHQSVFAVLMGEISKIIERLRKSGEEDK